jgi:hypothetical protein
MWPKPEALKLVGDPTIVAMEMVAESVPAIEGLKVSAPVVQLCPAASDAFAHVPLEIPKSALLLLRGAAGKLTGPWKAVKVMLPQVTVVPSATLPQLGMEPTDIVPFPDPCARKLLELPSPVTAERLMLVERLPATSAVKVMTPEVQVAPALKVASAQVPAGREKSLLPTKGT